MNDPMSVERRGAHSIARAGWLLAVLLLAAPFASLYHQPLGWGPPLIATALVLITAWRPTEGLLLLAALGTFSMTILALTRSGPASANFAEALVLAFLVGSTARRAVRPHRIDIPVRFGVAAAALLSVAVAAIVTTAVTTRIERPDLSVWALLKADVFSGYLVGSPLTAGMLYVEGLLLMLVVADVGSAPSERGRVARMMVLGAAAAALLNVLRIVTSAMAQPHPFTTFAAQLSTVRVNMHFPDLNAAGSYFALMLFIAIGLVRVAPLLAYSGFLSIAVAVWAAGSRTALAAVIGIGSVGAILRAARDRRRAYWLVAIALVLAIALVIGWKWYPQGRNLESGSALSYRITMARAALNLIAAHPIFGIGPGNFYGASGLSDNAHNNFLQIGADLGLPAVCLFLCVAAFALHTSWRHSSHDGVAWGLTAGLLVYLVTCLAGHPLLVPGAAYPFWIALGLAASFETRDSWTPAMRRAALASVLIVALTLPWQVSAAVGNADLEHSSVGLSQWQQRADGSRYRWAAGRATFYVSPATRSIRIPLRSGPMAPAVMEVRIFLDGVEANRVVLRSEEETIVRLNLLRHATTRFARIDLEARVPGAAQPLDIPTTDGTGVLMVGRLLPES
jgi:hypothetical protein